MYIHTCNYFYFINNCFSGYNKLNSLYIYLYPYRIQLHGKGARYIYSTRYTIYTNKYKYNETKLQGLTIIGQSLLNNSHLNGWYKLPSMSLLLIEAGSWR